jgi:hypothetical protein
MYDLELKSGFADSKVIADQVAETIAKRRRLRANDLRFDTIIRSILGSHVLYQQYRDDLPISTAWLRVDVSGDGEVYQVLNDLVPRTTIAESFDVVEIPAKDAERVARAAVETKVQQIVQCELVRYPVNRVPKPCWKVIVRTKRPWGAWKVYVDARDGSVVRRLDLVRHVTGKGRIFDPNPICALDDPSLTSSSTIPDEAYRDVELLGLDSSGFLDGEFVSTRATRDRVSNPTYDFTCRKDARAFREVMAYFHIDRVRRYLDALGFGELLNRAVEVNVDAGPEDVSQYDPVARSILFGGGGVADAEDAEIIVHEYGHAIQDDQIPGFGESGEARAMGEGFGDFLSASFFADQKPEAMRPMVGTWDARGYTNPRQCLRRVDGTKKYPKDIGHDVYADAEIWSACLWQLRAEVGRRTAEVLTVAHHHLLSRNATFKEAARAILTADKQLNGGANAPIIEKIFRARGILPRLTKRRAAGARKPHPDITDETRKGAV